MLHDGIIYTGTTDGRVVAINASSQEELWSRPVVTQVAGGLACGPSTVADALYTTPIVHGDLVYVGTYSGRVYALTVAQGAERWIYPRTGSIGAIVASPVIADETIYVSSSDGTVYALDVRHGDFKWRSERLADKLWTSATVVADRLYLSTLDGHLYTLSAETGQLLEWSFEGEAGFASCPVIYEDTIYVGSFDNRLYAIKIGDSEPVWTFSGRKWFWAAPLVHDGVVYAGCLDGKLYALAAETGEELGEFDAGSAIVSSPVLMDDLLIVVNESGNVHIFDLSVAPGNLATPLKTIAIDAGVRSSFCAEEGLVYIRGENNLLYIVDIDEGWIRDIPLTVEE